MAKHTQTICWQLFDHFVGLALKWLRLKVTNTILHKQELLIQNNIHHIVEFKT